MEPPQTWVSWTCRLTCQGQSPGEAFDPPTILLWRLTERTPHSEGDKQMLGVSQQETSGAAYSQSYVLNSAAFLWLPQATGLMEGGCLCPSFPIFRSLNKQVGWEGSKGPLISWLEHRLILIGTQFNQISNRHDWEGPG